MAIQKNFKKDISKSTQSNLDLWLIRLGYFSQIGLLIVAVIGYFYTVLPVYQKSVLDEEIAKKEIELVKMQKKLDENYVELRKQLAGQFIFSVGIDCTGMPKEALNFKSTNLKTDMLLHLSSRLQTNALTCLQSEFSKSSKLKTLKTDDYKLLNNEIEKVGNQIEIQRKFAIIKFENRIKQYEVDSKVEPLISITQAYFNISNGAIFKLKKLEWNNIK